MTWQQCITQTKHRATRSTRMRVSHSQYTWRNLGRAAPPHLPKVSRISTPKGVRSVRCQENDGTIKIPNKIFFSFFISTTAIISISKIIVCPWRRSSSSSSYNNVCYCVNNNIKDGGTHSGRERALRYRWGLRHFFFAVAGRFFLCAFYINKTVLPGASFCFCSYWVAAEARLCFVFIVSWQHGSNEARATKNVREGDRCLTNKPVLFVCLLIKFCCFLLHLIKCIVAMLDKSQKKIVGRFLHRVFKVSCCIERGFREK